MLCDEIWMPKDGRQLLSKHRSITRAQAWAGVGVGVIGKGEGMIRRRDRSVAPSGDEGEDKADGKGK
jgi:hypothetical protein